MSIYTRRGDDGSTGLFYGGRVGKGSSGPEAYGAVDEAVAALGVARVLADGELEADILKLQRQLFVVAAELATGSENRHKLEDEISRVTRGMVTSLEAAIDEVVGGHELPSEFVVPGGDALAAALDVARTVVRRAERRAVAHIEAAGVDDSVVVAYLNRCADYVYVLARAAEGSWTPSREAGR